MALPGPKLKPETEEIWGCGRIHRRGSSLQLRRSVSWPGIGLFAVGAHLSLANVGPQQERVKARREFVKDRLRKLLDDD
ncbi:hypothetical protein M0R45_029901 [Rubus argutus]|uniref:Uncharacterized protein n=1 Tax=Rubus argutus TaxID=59490 RepID=A0AAW1WDB7_RUBAR